MTPWTSSARTKVEFSQPEKRMKKTLALLGLLSFLALTFLVSSYGQSGQPIGNVKAQLNWTPNASTDAVSFYNVYLSLTNGVRIRTNSVTAPPLQLTSILFSLPNGVYNLNVTAVGLSGLESDPSSTLTFFWYGNKPGVPTNVVVEFFK